LQKGDLGLAVEALTTATRLDPNSALAQFALATAYERKSDAPSAIAAYKRAMALSPKNAAPYNNIAYLYATQRTNLGEALSLAQKAQELAPNDGGILDTLGFVHYHRGEFQQAEPVLKRASEALTTNAPVFYHLGMTYYKLGRRDDAASALRR